MAEKEVRDISVKKADNGGFLLRYTIYTPALAMSESSWEDFTLVFAENEKQKMMDELSTLLDKTI